MILQTNFKWASNASVRVGIHAFGLKLNVQVSQSFVPLNSRKHDLSPLCCTMGYLGYSVGSTSEVSSDQLALVYGCSETSDFGLRN
jgi:hypothetical protein